MSDTLKRFCFVQAGILLLLGAGVLLIFAFGNWFMACLLFLTIFQDQQLNMATIQEFSTYIAFYITTGIACILLGAKILSKRVRKWSSFELIANTSLFFVYSGFLFDWFLNS